MLQGNSLPQGSPEGTHTAHDPSCAWMFAPGSPRQLAPDALDHKGCKPRVTVTAPHLPRVDLVYQEENPRFWAL